MTKDTLLFAQDGTKYNLYDLPDGFVIKGDLDIRFHGLTELPDLSKVTVLGNFECSDNELTSLKGAPQKVGGDFMCLRNKLTSLEGSPREVSGNFICERNELADLKGAPQQVGGDFSCGDNKLYSLEGAPREVGKRFFCGYNNLQTLLGAPQKVGDDFSCGHNKLDSLYGITKLADRNIIYCDMEAVEKYGFEYGYFEARELYNNSVYRQEAIQDKTQEIMHRISESKKTREERDAERQAKLKSGFEAFKKRQAQGRE